MTDNRDQVSERRWRTDAERIDALVKEIHSQSNRIEDLEAQVKALQSNPNKGKGSRIAEDWQVSGEGRLYAKKWGLTHEDIEREAEKFYDWAISAPGQKGVKRDWAATWRTWVRKAAEQLGRSKPSVPEDSPTEEVVGPRTVEARKALARVLCGPDGDMEGAKIAAAKIRAARWQKNSKNRASPDSVDQTILFACDTKEDIARSRFGWFRSIATISLWSNQAMERKFLSNEAEALGYDRTKLNWPKVE